MVVDNPNEAAELLAISGCRYLQDSFHFLREWFNTISCDPIAQVFQLVSSKEGLLGIDLETGILKALEDSFELFKVVVMGSFGETEEIIDVGANKI